MAATFAGADTVGTAVASDSPPATIAPITIERIASSLRHSLADLSGLMEINKPASNSSAPMQIARGRGVMACTPCSPAPHPPCRSLNYSGAVERCRKFKDGQALVEKVRAVPLH